MRLFLGERRETAWPNRTAADEDGAQIVRILSRRTKRSLFRGYEQESILPTVLAVIVIVATACGSSGERTVKDLPSTPAGAKNLVIRVSGSKGVAYKGSYGHSIFEKAKNVKETTVKAEPTEYKVDLPKDKDKSLFASFGKTQSGSEQLKVEIVADGEVAADGSTNVEKGTVLLIWGNMPTPKPPKFKAPPPPKVPSPPKFKAPPAPKMPAPPKIQ
jgi:hypothetical protein